MSGVVVYPYAACKIQRRKCGDKCVLAPYFPPNDPHKFLAVHKLFGARNISKILQDIPAEKREDAVTSLVYEANVRLNDPIYGCTGAICRQHREIIHLRSQLATVQSELLKSQTYFSSLFAGFCDSGETATTFDVVHQNGPYNTDESGSRMDLHHENDPYNNDGVIVLQEYEDPFGLWAPLRTSFGLYSFYIIPCYESLRTFLNVQSYYLVNN